MKKQFFVVAAVLISSQLTAQQIPQIPAEDTSGKFLNEVVLTANKYPNKSSLTGKVITVISREQLERSGGKDLSQLLTEQAGIYIGGANSNPGKDKSIYLLGARVDHTLITIDGIPVYDASGIGGNFDIRNLAIENIERIEILKGSQSTLYGSDAIAGVINIISRKPVAKTLSGTGQLSYGSFNSLRAGAGVNGKKQNLDYSVQYNVHKSDGINEAVSTIGNPDKDGYSQHALVAGLGYQVNKKFRVQPFFRLTKIKGDLDQGAFTDELDYTYDQKGFQTGLRNELDLGKTKMTILYSFNSINRTYIDDSVKSRNGFDTYSRGEYKGQEHFLDAYVHVPITEKIKITGGVDFRSAASDQEFSSFGFYGPYNSQYSSDSLKQNQLGLYAALNLISNSAFAFEVGNRLNIHSEHGSHDVFNLNPSYLINKKWKLFVNHSSAYRTPSLYQLFSEYGNKKLLPESALTTEAGIQYYSPDNKVTARIMVFTRKVKDLIFFYFNPATFQSQYINQDKQNDLGLELETKINFSEKITLRAYYNFLAGEIITKQNGKDSTYSGLLRRPKNSFGINLGNQVHKKLYISTNLSAFGKRNDAYFDPLSFQTVNTVLKEYLLWNVYAEYSLLNNKIKIYTSLKNITDSRYTEISGFNTIGFNVQGGLRLQF